MQDTIEAPWSEQQVAALNAYQRSGRMHPFTCGGKHELHQTLIAEPDGWHCPDETCDYRQGWAHAFMADAVALAGIGVSVPRQQPFGAVEQVSILQAIAQPNLAAQLKRTRQQLRETEDQLAEARRRIEELTADGGCCGCCGDCEPEWGAAPTIEDVPVIGDML